MVSFTFGCLFCALSRRNQVFTSTAGPQQRLGQELNYQSQSWLWRADKWVDLPKHLLGIQEVKQQWNWTCMRQRSEQVTAYRRFLVRKKMTQFSEKLGTFFDYNNHTSVLNLPSPRGLLWYREEEEREREKGGGEENEKGISELFRCCCGWVRGEKGAAVWKILRTAG